MQGTSSQGSATGLAAGTAVPGRSAADRPATRARAVRATVFSVAGEVLITLGLLIALYLVYQLWWTNVIADRQVARNSVTLLRKLNLPPAAAAVVPSDSIPVGQGFAFLYIPALGADWRALIMQGVDRTTVLNTGAVGHYTGPGTSLPWDASGNFALAGHRDGHGMIFRDLNQLAVGDKVYVQSQYGWYVYQLDREDPSVSVDDISVIDSIPAGSGYTAAGHYITLTTCTPIYVDTSRMIWWGHLVDTTHGTQAPPGVTPVQ
jgi:sortase A